MKKTDVLKTFRFLWYYHLQLSTMPQISFNLFCSENKRLLSVFLRTWCWFQGHNKRFSKYLGLKKKNPFLNGTRICRWKSTDNNDFNIFLSLENPCTILLTKEKTWKRIFNTNSELSQNCTEKQIMPSKATINWLFNDIWCFSTNSCKSPLYP